MRYGATHITTANGQKIYPEEVEKLLLKHPAIDDVGAIVVQDIVLGKFIKAFVSLRPGYDCSCDLEKQFLALAGKYLPNGVLREIAFKTHLPRTKSGKILREMLKSREFSAGEINLAGIH